MRGNEPTELWRSWPRWDGKREEGQHDWSRTGLEVEGGPYEEDDDDSHTPLVSLERLVDVVTAGPRRPSQRVGRTMIAPWRAPGMVEGPPDAA